MKNYLIGTIYISLLTMAFAFFALMDKSHAVTNIGRLKKTVPVNSQAPKDNQEQTNDYTFSPLRFIDSYN